MRTALIADVHSNLEALEACMRHATQGGAERFAFLGDLVGYGADASAVVDRVAAEVARGAIAVKGNHDVGVETPQRELDDVAHEALVWTRDALSSEQRAFLRDLPLCVREEDVCFVHASADRPERWHYIQTAGDARESIDAADRTWTFGGHLHNQVLFFKTLAGKTAPFRPTPASPVPVPSHRGWMVIAGSAGQPRDGNPAAAYALFDSDREEVTFFRIAYDHFATAEKIRRAGLPSSIAHRIENGF